MLSLPRPKMKKPRDRLFSILEAFTFGSAAHSISACDRQRLSALRLSVFELALKGIPKLLSSYYKSLRLSIIFLKVTVLTWDC